MSHTKKYQNYDINVIVNKKLKNSYISIDRERSITLKTPHQSQSFIDSLIEEKSSWIERQLLKIEGMRPISNEACHSLDFLRDRVEYFSQEMQLDFKELKFKKMRSRWGSCSSLGVITLNSELTKVQSELVDYVVVHELAHLVHMNHSRAFHTLVQEYLPDSKALRKELQKVRLL